MDDPRCTPLVRTLHERCRVCYTCVRECPAKAIRIEEGQAEVVPDRCIGCGNCIKVCSQQAKAVRSASGRVGIMLKEAAAGTGPKVAACVAPSFPAEFCNIEPLQFVTMLRELGFSYVTEVAFGADLVADRYVKLLKNNKENHRYIATTCPALVEYAERYFPQLVDHLAPIVSPMVAIARAIRKLHGDDLNIVFIGPCIAKKNETVCNEVAGDVDAALTFVEIRNMLTEAGLISKPVEPSDFDPPRAGLGALFPISRGMLQAADIKEDLLATDVVAAEGRVNFVEAIKEFDAGTLDAKLLEVLCCNGCIMGPGMSTNEPLYRRRSRVSQYVHSRIVDFNEKQWKADVAAFEDLDLSRDYKPNDQRVPIPSDEELSKILNRMGKFSPTDELNCGACGYDSCREHAIAIYKGLAESEMCLPYTIEQLRRACTDLEFSNEQLASAQQALMQAEKLASMGQLAAGIAHEVNNPLGVVLLYAHLLLDECHDDDLKDDLKMVVEQADRCKKIVSGLLHFARQNKVALQPTDIAELVDRNIQALRLADNVELRVEKAAESAVAEVDRDQITQVLTNLVSNAQAAMPDGGTITISIDANQTQVSLSVADTGVGIPKENLDKIFEPFFTTKQIGKGTGLGLAVTYGIVKMHRGDITVESNADPANGQTGTKFTVILPRKGQQD